MTGINALHITDTKTGRKAPFVPANPDRVRMYVCGPTVYDRAHLGNARSAVVFDLLFRLLRQVYSEAAVIYARNFTDIDDKIIAGAAARYPEMEPESGIFYLTRETIRWYREDMGAIGVLRPTHEPRATRYVDEMIEDIERMIEAGGAYVAEGHVFFDVTRNPVLGHLSGRTELDDAEVHRIEPNPLKRHPADFVLWKPSKEGEPSWFSPWGRGRPGWHIECSAMATRLLGEEFDIHGGGSDLIFPHHDNEVAQAKCCSPDAGYARTWIHNGMITVDGRKMSKSLGNFTTVADLRSRLPGGAIRLALLSAHYRANLDWTEKLEAECLQAWRRWAELAQDAQPARDLPAGIWSCLADDMNTAGAIAELHRLHAEGDAAGLRAALDLLGISTEDDRVLEADVAERIEALLARRRAARESRDFTTSDAIRHGLVAAGVVLKDSAGGTAWEAGADFDAEAILALED